MQHALGFEIEYREHLRQMARANAEEWQFATGEKRYSIQQIVARVCIAIAARYWGSQARERIVPQHRRAY